MGEYIYNIPTKTKFSYERDENQNHLLFVLATWVSPVTGQEVVSKKELFGLAENSEADFYRLAEGWMLSEILVKEGVANAMAADLKKQLEANGGIDFLQIAREKFQKNLQKEYSFDLYIDLDRANQTGNE